MLKITNELRKYELIPNKYINKNNVTIVDTSKGKYVFKKTGNNNIFNYLNARSFTYYPEIVSNNDDEYMITRYIDDIDMPKEQKMDDLVELVGLLHNKTTHYKEVDIDDYKKIYEDISNNIAYLYSYYNDLMTIIESKVYMSPSEYLLATKSSLIYQSLNYTHNEIEEWYKLVKDKKKERLVVLHNNLKLDHFIRNDNPYLISWDKSKIDMPIFDIYKLYKNHNLDFDFSEILKKYESNYPLQDDERKLLFILIALPDKIEFGDDEYDMCIKIQKMIESLYKSELLISPYYSKNTKED